MAEVKMLTAACPIKLSKAFSQSVVGEGGVVRGVGSRVVMLSVESDVGLLMRRQLGARPGIVLSPSIVHYSAELKELS